MMTLYRPGRLYVADKGKWPFAYRCRIHLMHRCFCLFAMVFVPVMTQAAESDGKRCISAQYEVYDKWPFSMEEAKHRQEQTANALGVPIEKILRLPRGVTLKLVLIPAGRFVMGCRRPIMPIKPSFGGLELSLTALTFLIVLFCGLIGRTIRLQLRFQFSLRAGFIAFLLASFVVWGWVMNERFDQSLRNYHDAMKRYTKTPLYEKPAHVVTITRPFYISQMETTGAQYKAVVGENLDASKDETIPVFNVSWENAREYCKTLGKILGIDARLPTEAEWEFACRAGMETRFAFGDQLNPSLANYKHTQVSVGVSSDLACGIKPGGRFPPNHFGLFDMHGNTDEWCDDLYYLYEARPVKDPPDYSYGGDGSVVVRGGSWYSSADECTSFKRYIVGPRDEMVGAETVFGFRICVSL